MDMLAVDLAHQAGAGIAAKPPVGPGGTLLPIDGGTPPAPSAMN
jgi:hypothetical protein